jgi:opacity protein-like surface antigen
VGEGFRCGAQSLTLSAGATYGFTAFGGKESHDLALGSLTYGVMLDNTVNKGHWYQGNIEFRGQLFGGEQFSPRREWLVGLTPHIRYNFATGSRWIPYIDGGAGVTLTSIREPDLGGVFEFNLQAAAGVEWFLTDNVALTVQAGYLHMSSADIYTPNRGLNCVTGMAGVSFFF